MTFLQNNYIRLGGSDKWKREHNNNNNTLQIKVLGKE